MSNLMWKSEGSEDGNREEQKMLKGKKSGVWKREKQVMLRLECGKARAMETEMWRLSKSKRKKEKGGKMFLKEWNQNGVKDWRVQIQIGEEKIV